MNYLKANDCSLKQYNTLRINSTAATIVYPLNKSGLKEIFEEFRGKKIIILGNGSNILFSKSYYDESFVFLSFKLMENIEMKQDNILVEAGATLSKLSWFALENGVKGYEFLEDVPGSIGGAIIMNAGTYQDNIGQLVNKITYFEIDQREIITTNVVEEDFGRRESKWTNKNCIILSVELSAAKEEIVNDYENLIDKLFQIKKSRYLKQPRNYPNAGSVFKRPSLNGEDFYVWKLFDELDLRGLRKNGAMISQKHPGFIVNVDDAKPEDVLYLIILAQKKVMNKYGIDLELEWKII